MILLNEEKNLLRLLVNSFIKKGKKKYTEKLAYSLLKTLKFTLRKNSLLVLHGLSFKIRPVVTLRGKKVAGVTIKIPALIRAGQDLSVAVKWFVYSVNNKVNLRTLEHKVITELLDLVSNTNSFVIKKRKELHKMALSNRPFLKYV